MVISPTEDPSLSEQSVTQRQLTAEDSISERVREPKNIAPNTGSEISLFSSKKTQKNTEKQRHKHPYEQLNRNIKCVEGVSLGVGGEQEKGGKRMLPYCDVYNVLLCIKRTHVFGPKF